MPAKTIEELEKKFATAMTGWGKLATQSVQAQGQPGVGMVVNGMQTSLLGLVAKLWRGLKQVITNLNPFGLLGEVGAFLEAGIEDMLDTANKLIEDLIALPGAVAGEVVGAVMGLFEAIKKAIHLILDRIKLPAVTDPIETVLDLINNLMGNIAELVSPQTGKMARTLRMNMYGQLAGARAASAAKRGDMFDDDQRDEL